MHSALKWATCLPRSYGFGSLPGHGRLGLVCRTRLTSISQDELQIEARLD